MEIKTDPEFSN